MKNYLDTSKKYFKLKWSIYFLLKWFRLFYSSLISPIRCSEALFSTLRDADNTAHSPSKKSCQIMSKIEVFLHAKKKNLSWDFWRTACSCDQCRIRQQKSKPSSSHGNRPRPGAQCRISKKAARKIVRRVKSEPFVTRKQLQK